ncbi:hypothetical protein Psuf_053310 [Phytohabitans suffuscus]|uniref:DUF4276 family protein n=1 Tax=Phytohabitans suffuscus TaxID=624315 RepID=A0A6F8YQ38_9ACTN|nr:hypothetical protein Psuf_053310 [Phytohabitans suffuscus]
MLPKVAKDVGSRIRAGSELVGEQVDVIVVHRDADNAGAATRRTEIEGALRGNNLASALVPVIPVRMTEAWLLLDETAIRRVAGNPRGKNDLGLPKVHQAESVADPKELLNQCLLAAANVTGRRRDSLRKRFSQNRRQLLERLDRNGPITQLPSWRILVSDIGSVTANWASRD